MSLAWEIRQSSGLKLIIHVLSECRGPSPFFAHVNSQDFGSQRAALSFRLQMWSVLACCVPSRSVVSDSLPPHGLQPARLPRPWGPPGKNTGVGCHFLLQCLKVKIQSEFARSCLTPSNLMDCSPPGSSVHGIFQARVLELE